MSIRRRAVLRQLLGAPIAGAGLAGCADGAAAVIPYTSVDQVFSEPIFRAFEAAAGVRARAVFDTEETKSTGVLNRLIAEAANPQADVFWSGDPVRPFQLIRRGLVEAYVSPQAQGLPASALGADGLWTGFAARARVLLVNHARVGGEAQPTSILDLADSRWRGVAAMANPLFGTTTMHVGALFAQWGAPRTRDFLNALRGNGVRVASSNGEVRRLVASGEATFGLTDTDDASEALREGADVAVVYPDQDRLGTLVIPTSIVLIRNGPNPVNARRLIDFLLSPEVEREMAERAAHMPLRPGVRTPAHVRALEGLRTMQVDYARVAEEIEAQQAWLRDWVGL